MEKVKNDRYGEICHEIGFWFVPLVFETYGRPGEGTIRFLKEIAKLGAGRVRGGEGDKAATLITRNCRAIFAEIVEMERHPRKVGTALYNLEQSITSLQQTQEMMRQTMEGLVARVAALPPQLPPQVLPMSEEGTQQLVVPSQGPDLREQLPWIALKQLDKFTGRRDTVERFITDTNDYFTKLNVNVAPHRQLGLAKSFLCKELRDWFDLRVKRGMGFADWPALHEVLRRRYKEKYERRKARKQVLSLRCTGMVDDYNKEFSLLALKITNTSEEDLVEDYIEGLPPRIMYETDRIEPAILDEAMEKALDSEIWLKQASSRSQSRWSRGPPSDPSPVIDPTGPAPIELCGVGVRPSRRLPPRHPLIPQTVWESKGRLNRCLLCGENTHMMAACRNGPQLPPYMQTIQTTSQSRSPWPPRASPGFAPFVLGFGVTPGYPWP
uniref:Retrotransposon gag domain-containing protein n=1 Tax=Chromera velia CCMP2878 TaxID=1169474 RepID=A0A0G4H611_9ALVE|eukprot:Cvel_5728.t1-p1 / transcript=Cvel_5728.t1 / gene=Cvel_5728 / organism=Chromera_velia_CCMP2878 / gene_product=hypothetical protein / transcript_product=hypothetical protein / location=Cvel_scaffold271:79928-85304(-) / protein_length=438 / sequence_SO=supercontig / SO=protein_coding / is_pseudo=false